MTDARTAILGRIRAANAAAGVPPLTIADAEASWAALPREYRKTAAGTREEILALLEDRLLDYDATVTRCRPEDATAALAGVLRRAAVERIGVPAGMASALQPEGFAFVADEGLSYGAMAALEAVLTRCTVAIAETGTLVLQSGPEQGRRALTLIPDVHVCVVAASEVVATVPEAFARLAAHPELPTTFVSGPSATADIEMTRVKGVHGPRFLHVLLVEDQL